MDPLLGRLQRALQGRYAVEQELGRGGMATVFLGHDLRLERRVAIKVFEEGGGLIAAGERFLREIRIAAQLQHPNILPVHDSGEGEGLVYYIMPYVAGGSLRERLEREGPLPVADAVRIGREVAEALDHAHRAGIIHRDIKPDNIMLADGVAVVADFGIARAIEQGGGKVTETGLAIGTPTYMSPEQAAASPQVDGRTDLYALGCVLYEMLAGAPPFSGLTAQQVMARHAVDPVPSLNTVRPVQPALEAAIQRALGKTPADRWPSGLAMAEALSRALNTATVPWTSPSRARVTGSLAAALVLVLVIVAVAPRGEPVAAPLRSVAVLPVDARGDSTLTDIADALAEAVITGLVRVEGLQVPAVSRIAGAGDRDPREIGRALGVQAVLVSSVRRIGSTMRLSPQLIGVDDGLVLWSGNFDGDIGDVWAMVDSLTLKTVDGLKLRLTAAGREALARGVRTRDTVAYKLYLDARRANHQLTKASTERARALLEQAIARDSMFADAWAALAQTLDFEARFSSDPPEHFNAAIRRAANRAIELDSLNGLPLVQRAWIKGLQDWDWDGARRDVQRARSLSPGSVEVLRDYALIEFLNQPDSLLVYARQTLDSTAAGVFLLGASYQWAGKPDSALVAFERVAAIDSNFSFNYLTLAMGYLDVGRRAEAERAIARFLEFSGDDAQGIGWAAVYYRRAGDLAGARQMERRLAALERTRSWGVHSARSMVRLALGDRAGALEALEAAAQSREYLLPATLLDALAPLRDEPRWQAVSRMVYGERDLPHAMWP